MTASADMTPEIASILAEVARLGIMLQAETGKIRFRPRSAMTADLAQRITTHRSALLALLSDPTPSNDAATGPHGAESGVSSVVSVSEPPERARDLWSQDELALLARAGTTPADLPLVSAVKDAFADASGGGAIVVSIEPAYGRARSTRDRAADLVRGARHDSADESQAVREAWLERRAVSAIDGKLPKAQAEQVALEELEKVLHLRTRGR